MTSETDNLSDAERERLAALKRLAAARRALDQAEQALGGDGSVPLAV